MARDSHASGIFRKKPPFWWLGLMAIYQISLPLLLLVALPSWLVRMIKRGGKGSGLSERIGIHEADREWEPCGAVHVHAISVGEAMLAMRLIRAWKERSPQQPFVLATGTATGHAVARAGNIDGMRVTYAPLDVPAMVLSYINRFEPERLVLVEGEVWPNLMAICQWRGIPASLVNARMSPRSERRYRKFAPLLRPLFSKLSHVALQEEGHREIWQRLGVANDAIHLAGSLKFDPGNGGFSRRRPEFDAILKAFAPGPVVVAASTHASEEPFLATHILRAAPNAIIVIVPRHIERASDAARDLQKSGFRVIRRSAFPTEPIDGEEPVVLLVDTTGELRDWLAHAAVALIGKSFLSHGGQNPAEAILAGIPVIFGEHMENFEPLASQLVRSGGALRTQSEAGLTSAISSALNPEKAQRMKAAARTCMRPHEGAIDRVIDLVS